MRIIAVQTGLSGSSALGGTITDRKFLCGLADRGVEVHVLTGKNSYPIIDYPNLIPHYYPYFLRRRFRMDNNLYVAFFVRKLRRKLGDVDWVRFNSPYLGFGALVGAGKVPVWASYLHCEEYPFHRFADRWQPKNCSLITCLSHATRRELIRRCPKADHDGNVVIPIGIETERYQPDKVNREKIRRGLGIEEDETVLLFMGQLIPRKGIDELVEIWKRVRRLRKVRLLVIGKAKPDTMELQRRIEALAREDWRVVYIEYVPYEENHAYFQAGDIFVFPTRLEGFGIVVGEALASGLPVVTTQASGVSEVVDRRCSMQFDVGDVEGGAKAVEELVSDGKRRRAMGKNGMAHVRNRFGWTPIMDSLMDCLEGEKNGQRH